MRKIFSFLSICLCTFSFHLFATCWKSDCDLRLGYACSQFDCRQEGKVPQLETFKEFKWSSIQSPVVGGSFLFHPFFQRDSKNWWNYISVRVDANFLLNSFSSDFSARYRENDVSTIFHPKKSSISHMRGSDVSVALKSSYPVNTCFAVACLLGYQGEDLHFRQRLGRLTSDAPGAADVASLHAKDLFYKLHWNTVWVGLESEFSFCEGWQLFGSLSYYKGNFNGHGNWKANKIMIDNFLFNYDSKLSQKGTLHGIRADIGVEYPLLYCLKLGAKIQGEVFKNLGRGKCETEIGQTIVSPGGTMIGQSILTSHNGYDLCWKSVSGRIYLNYNF